MASAAEILFSTQEHTLRECHEVVGRLLARGMLETETGPSEVALALGIRRQAVQQMRRGERPVYAHHLIRLPRALRAWMFSKLAAHMGKLIADRLEAKPGSVRKVLREVAGEVTPELVGLSGERVLTRAKSSKRLRRVGEKMIRLGGGLVGMADELDREGVLGQVED